MVISRNFTFNGTSSSDMNIIAVTLDDEFLMDLGIPFNRSISAEKYTSTYTSFKMEDNMPDEITINLLYVDNNLIPQRWTQSKIIEVKNWIVTDDFARFISNDTPDYFSYLICTKIQNRMTSDMIGVLECTFQPMSHFQYRETRYVGLVTNGTITINNPSLSSYKPVMKITNLGGTGTVNTVGDFQISGLSSNEVATVDNLMCTAMSSDNTNILSSCNREWVELQPGENTIRVTGNLRLEIICEFPVLL